MASRSRKIKVGVFVVGGALLVAIALVLIGTASRWRPHNTYYAWFDDSVGGLATGAAVDLRGVRIGEVSNIELVEGETLRVRVTMEIKPGAPIREGAYARLTRIGLSSLMSIDIGGADPGGARLPPGSALEGQPSMFDKAAKDAIALMQRGDEVVDRADELLDNLNALAGDDTRERVTAILTQGEQLVGDLRTTSRRMRSAATEAQGLLADGRQAIADTRNDVDRAVDSAEQLFADSGELVRDAKRVLRVNEQQIRTTVQNLRVASQNVKELGRMLRARPSRLLFGGAPKDRKLP